MRFFAATFDYILIRFFLMMACVIGGLFAGQPIVALLALPFFLSAILGVSFLPEKEGAAAKAQPKTTNNLAKVPTTAKRAA